MIDARPVEQQILDRMQVPGSQGLFVLGCFERRVTLYSQQVRALNLMFALRDQLLATRPAVGVIGAGASGLTAAAAAAACGCRVVVFERLGRPLGFIGPARTRWLHPHIYDWPADDAENPDAELPLLTWREEMADKVGDALRTQWNELTRRFPIELHCDVTDLTLDESSAPAPGSRRRHVLTWNGRGPEPVDAGSSRRWWMDELDLVVLAVGFGVERPTAKYPQVTSYWENDRIDEEDRRSKRAERRVLISGTGDGGLIDLLRYSFAGFRHDEILTRLRTHLAAQGQLDRVLQAIHEIEAQANDRARTGEAYAATMSLAYRRLADSLQVRDLLPIRRNIRPTLTGRGSSPFDLESAALNRFLASFTEMEFIARGTRSVSRPREDGPFLVTFANGETQEFDEVLVRHGPASALKKSFREIWDRCRDLETMARATPDPTRLPLYGRFYDDLLGATQVQTEPAMPPRAPIEPPAPVEPPTLTPAEPPQAPEPPRPAAAPHPAADVSGLIGVPIERFSDVDFYERLVKAPDSVDRQLLRVCTGWAVHRLPLRGGILKRLAKMLVSLVSDAELGGSQLFATIAASLAGADADRLEPFVDRLSDIAELDGERHARDQRARAIIALGQLKSPAAVPVLIESLRHDERDLRELAATALGTIGEPSAVTWLVDAYLHDPGTLVFDDALRALVSIGGEQVLVNLLTILGDTNLSPNLRWPVAAALAAFREPPRVIIALLNALKDDNALVREHAARSLGIFHSLSSADWLVPLLDDARMEVRVAAVDALGRFGSADATRHLLRAFDDEHWAVREAAGLALQRLNPGALLSAAMMRFTSGPATGRDESVRWLCEIGGIEWAEANQAAVGVSAKAGFVSGLSAIGGTRAARLLLPYVDDASATIRRDAIQALGKEQYRPALSTLVKRMLTDSSDEVRIAATISLGEIRDPAAIDALCDALRMRPPLGFFAAIALGRIGDARAIPALIEASPAAPWSDRMDAVPSAIAQIGGAPAVEALTTLYVPQTSPGRARIMHELRAIDHPDVVSLALRGTADEDAEVRRLAFDALRERSWMTVKAGLAQALWHADADVRRQALGMVAIYADDDMRARIAELVTQDPDAAVRTAAAEARHDLEAVDALRAYGAPTSESKAEAEADSGSTTS